MKYGSKAMNDTWTDRLSEYLDGELSATERAELEDHLGHCADCRSVLAELRRVVGRAQALEDRPVAAELWTGIADRIGAPAAVRPIRHPRRYTFTAPQLLAAGIALAILSGGGAWLARPDRLTPAPTVAATPSLTPDARTVANRAEPSYDSSVAELEQLLAAGRGSLDTMTVRVLEQNLALIDRAIADARTAIAHDPANAYLSTHLARTMRRKIELLRQAAELASAQS
jgi:hypothetical protein